MSEISYFQHYSQPENHITNNTLLILRHVYHHSPLKLQKLLDELLEEKVKVGVFFTQQTKGENSIPDGAIRQDNFNIIIEAKRHGKLSTAQLIEHSKQLTGENSFLIGLTTDDNKMSSVEIEHINRNFGNFFNITYSELVDALKKITDTHEAELQEIIDDYVSFIQSEHLINDKHNKLVAVPCGWSINENVEYELYYAPLGRNNHYLSKKFIGLYKDKKVQYVGEIIATIARNANEKEPYIEEINNSQNEEHCIIKVKKWLQDYNHRYLEQSQRFYLVEKFCPTNFEKKTKFGVRGKNRNFNLSDYDINLDKNASAQQLAELLNGKTFD